MEHVSDIIHLISLKFLGQLTWALMYGGIDLPIGAPVSRAFKVVHCLH